MKRRAIKNYNAQLLEKYGIKPIAYNPYLAIISKSATAGLLLSQLLYWWGKGRNKDSIYKTVKELQKETQLTRSAQERAIKIWGYLGVLEVKNKGVPPKRHFKINLEIVEKLLSEKCGKCQKQQGSNAVDHFNSQDPAFYYREYNQENTGRNPYLQ